MILCMTFFGILFSDNPRPRPTFIRHWVGTAGGEGNNLAGNWKLAVAVWAKVSDHSGLHPIAKPKITIRPSDRIGPGAKFQYMNSLQWLKLKLRAVATIGCGYSWACDEVGFVWWQRTISKIPKCDTDCQQVHAELLQRGKQTLVQLQDKSTFFCMALSESRVPPTSMDHHHIICFHSYCHQLQGWTPHRWWSPLCLMVKSHLRTFGDGSIWTWICSATAVSTQLENLLNLLICFQTLGVGPQLPNLWPWNMGRMMMIEWVWGYHPFWNPENTGDDVSVDTTSFFELVRRWLWAKPNTASADTTFLNRGWPRPCGVQQPTTACRHLGVQLGL